MKIFPAIDLYEGKAVRLVRGDYASVTVYSDDPPKKALEFKNDGAEFLHVVDLEGARDGTTPNIDTVRQIAAASDLKVEIGGGIRTHEVIEKYLDAGVMRVILGTAAITEPGFVEDAVRRYGGSRVAVGVDVRDGFVAIKGWTELSDRRCLDFCRELEEKGVLTVICTDISKDGLLSGANLDLYRELAGALKMDIVASGGVTTVDDVAALRNIGLYGAIIGKSLYTGGIELAAAIAAGEAK